MTSMVGRWLAQREPTAAGDVLSIIVILSADVTPGTFPPVKDERGVNNEETKQLGSDTSAKRLYAVLKQQKAGSATHS